MKKRERSLLYQKLQQKLKKEFKDLFIYKIPDTAGLGGKRPFDFIIVLNGVPIALEIKSYGDSITPYQKESLRRFNIAGGIQMVFFDGDDINDFLLTLIAKCNQRIDASFKN